MYDVVTQVIGIGIHLIYNSSNLNENLNGFVCTKKWTRTERAPSY